MATKTLTGTIKDTGSQPVNGARVELQPFDTNGKAGFFYGSAFILAPRIATTGGNGVFTITTVPANDDSDDATSYYRIAIRGKTADGEGYSREELIRVMHGNSSPIDFEDIIIDPPVPLDVTHTESLHSGDIWPDDAAQHGGSSWLTLTEMDDADVDTPNPGDVSYFVDEATGHASVKHEDDSVVDLEAGPTSITIAEPRPVLYFSRPGIGFGAPDSSSANAGSEFIPFEDLDDVLVQLQPGYGGTRSSLIGDALGGNWACDLVCGPGPQFYLMPPPWGGWDTADPPWAEVSIDGSTPYTNTGNNATDLAALKAVLQLHQITTPGLMMPNFVRILGNGVAGKEADSTGFPAAGCWIVGDIDHSSDDDALLIFGSTSGNERSGQNSPIERVMMTNYGDFGACIYAGKEIPMLELVHDGFVFSNGWGVILDQSGMDTFTLRESALWGNGQQLATSGALGDGGGLVAMGGNPPNMFNLEGTHLRQNFGEEFRHEGGSGPTGGATRLVGARFGTGGVGLYGAKGLIFQSYYWEQGNSVVNRRAVMNLCWVDNTPSVDSHDRCHSIHYLPGARLHGKPVTRVDAVSSSYGGGKLRIYITDTIPAYVPFPTAGGSVDLSGWTSSTNINTTWTIASTDGSTYIEITMANPTVTGLGHVDVGMATSNSYYGDGSSDLLPYGFDVQCGGGVIDINADRWITPVGSRLIRHKMANIDHLEYRIVATNEGGNSIDTQGMAFAAT